MWESIERALSQIKDPYLGKNLLETGVIKKKELTAEHLLLGIQLGYPAKLFASAFEAEITQALQKAFPSLTIKCDVSWKVASHVVQKGVKTKARIHNMIAIASGKGGVGKSTTAANLALALQREGARVGMLDADIYGPSQPTLLGCQGAGALTEDKQLLPVMAHGLAVMSIGFLIPEDTPMVWRGPMVSGTLQQLLNDTLWPELDYLIVDLPPGTGDTQLTLAQHFPISGAIIVTTPQDIALLDAKKGLAMFRKVDVPVLGIIENMSTHFCTHCGHEDAIFGQGGGEKMARQYDVPLLGTLPLDKTIREQADGGMPTLVCAPESPVGEKYRQIALKAAAILSQQAKDYAAAIPRIVIENT